jgi:hypothetical protein
LQDWFYITYGEKKPFEYAIENGKYKVTIPYPNNLKMPGDVILAQMVDPNEPKYNKVPVVKGPSKRLDFDSLTIYRDSIRNLFMSKIFGYAGILRGFLIVVPPVVINEDQSEARLYLPSPDKLKIPTIDDILKIITNMKLFPSLDQYQIKNNLDEAIKNNDNYVLIAKGRSMEEAFNDYVIPSVSLEKSVGKLQEDGKMDYKERGAIKEVFEGDLVGEFYKGSSGKEGFNVFGQKINIVRSIKGSEPGKNLYLDADNSRIMRSSINGYLEINHNVLDVNETLVIESDINYETGNIEFSGNIEIKGKVCDGFSVTCFGNLTVHGVVEAANLFSRNDMLLVSGVISKAGYKIECLGNMKARFLQNANVLIKKNLIVDDFIYDCNIRCNGAVKVTEKSGVVVGGKITALRKIEVKVAGNKGGVLTELICGVDHELNNKISNKKKELLRYQEAQNTLNEKIKESFSANFLRNPANYIANLPEDKKKTALQVVEKIKSINDLILNTQASIEKLEKLGDKYDFTPEIVINLKKFDGVKERIVSFGKVEY